MPVAGVGYAGGTLACDCNCTFDVSGCCSSRFVDNGDGTITDNATGLMWEKKTEEDGTANYSNLHDANNGYVWGGNCSAGTLDECQPTLAAQQLCASKGDGGRACRACDTAGGEGTCSASETVWTWAVALNTASFAGYTDWRIPKRLELESILRSDLNGPANAFKSPGCVPACTDITDPDCSCTGIGWHWSATYYVGSALYEAYWQVDFYYSGEVRFEDFTQPFFVRAVRGGS